MTDKECKAAQVTDDLRIVLSELKKPWRVSEAEGKRIADIMAETTRKSGLTMKEFSMAFLMLSIINSYARRKHIWKNMGLK